MKLGRSPLSRHKQYDTAADIKMGSFTWLVCFAEEIVYKNHACFQIRIISETLARKWAKTHSLIMKWVRVQSQLSIIRAISLHLRGTRQNITSIAFEVGVALPYFKF